MRLLKIFLLLTVALTLVFAVTAYKPCSGQLKIIGDTSDMGYQPAENYHVQLDYVYDDFVNTANEKASSSYLGYNPGHGIRFSMTYQYDDAQTTTKKETKPINVKYVGYNPGHGGHAEVGYIYDELMPTKKVPCGDYYYPTTATIPSYMGCDE